MKHRKNPSYGRIRTWPNAVSALRLALALAAAVLFLAFGLILAPILLSVVASLLDFLDGWLARRMRQITRLGEHLDPLADKVLVTVVFGALAWFLRELWVSVAVSLLLLREWGITWLREFVQRRQQLTLPAGRMGKWKMLSQSLFGNLFLFWMSRAPDARPGEGTFLPTLGLALGLILVLSYASAIRYLGRLSS